MSHPLDLLEADEYFFEHHACLTGDCPHEKTRDCLVAAYLEGCDHIRGLGNSREKKVRQDDALEQPWWHEIQAKMPAEEAPRVLRTFNGSKLKWFRERRRIEPAALANWAQISIEDLELIEAGRQTVSDKTAELLVIGVTGRKP